MCRDDDKELIRGFLRSETKTLMATESTERDGNINKNGEKEQPPRPQGEGRGVPD
jgi:hypothetical protein